MKELDIKSTTDKKGEKVSLIKVNNGEAVQLFLYEDQEAPNKYVYEWMANRFQTDPNKISSSGNNLAYYRGERKVLIQFPSFYCGYDINVYLNLVKKNLAELFASGESEEHVFNKISWNPNNRTDNEDSLSFVLKRTDTTSRVFRAECPILLNEVRWLNKHYKDLPLLAGTKPYLSLYKPRGFIYCKVEGLNDREIKYELFYNEESSGVQTATPFQNDLYIPFEIPKSLLIPQKITPVIVKLRLIEYGINSSEEKQKVQSVTGYLNKIFSKEIFVVGKYELEDVLEDLLTNNLMPVVVGNVNIVANNHMPCKFTEVVFSEEEEGKNVFSETGSNFENFVRDTFYLTWRTLEEHPYTQQKKYDELSFYQVQPFAMISGMESKKVNVSIKNFETNKCKLKPKHDSKIIYLDGEKRKLQTEKKDGVVQVEDQLDINYNYDLERSIFFPWDYFFPFNKRQRHYLKIDSCRHSINLPIDVYPDIQWAFTLKFDIVEGKKAESFSGLFSDEIRPGVYDITPRKTKREVIKNSLEIGFGVSWNSNSLGNKHYSGITINVNDAKNAIKEDGVKGILANYLKNELYIQFKLLYDMVMDVVGFLQMFETVLKIVQTVEDVTGQNLPVPEREKSHNLNYFYHL